MENITLNKRLISDCTQRTALELGRKDCSINSDFDFGFGTDGGLSKICG
jgi:hypothetical protein